MPTYWKDLPIHVIDFEGSGDYGVIEYGVAILKGGAVAECHSGVCEAEEEIDTRDSWVHGLKRQDTDGQPRFVEHWELFNGWRKQGLFAAHHATVENRLIKRVWPYPSASPAHVGQETTNQWGPWIDTRALYQAVYPALKEHKLGALIETFDLQKRLDDLAKTHCPGGRCRYHCALYDALASALLLIHIAEQRGFEAMSIEWLIEHSLPATEAAKLRQQDML